MTYSVSLQTHSEDEWIPTSCGDTEDAEIPSNNKQDGRGGRQTTVFDQSSDEGALDTEQQATNEEHAQHVSKRKRSDPSQWQRSKEKVQRWLSKTQPTISKCRCQCNKKIAEEMYKNVFKNFVAMNHSEQNIYLRGCINLEITKRHINKNKPRHVFTYTVLLNNQKIEICQKIFLEMQAIKRDRLRKKFLIENLTTYEIFEDNIKIRKIEFQKLYSKKSIIS